MGKQGKEIFSTRQLVYIGVIAALVVVATMIKIPYGNGAMVHLGSAAIYTSALVFGGVPAGLGAAIGSALFDLILGFGPYTLFSFFIKGAAGLTGGLVSHAGNHQGKTLWLNLLALILAAAVTLVGYLIAWTVVLGSFEAAVLNIPSSLITSAVGIIVALPLSLLVKRALKNR